MERQDKLVEMYNYALSKGFCTNKKSFAEYVGINPSNISKIFHDSQGRYLTNSTLLKINSALNNVFSQDWVLTGRGAMLVEQSGKGAGDSVRTGNINGGNGLPLIPIDAVAGFNGVDVQGVRLEDCSRYVVPEFAELHAEYMIRVSGSSMYPKYSNGDLLACRRVQEVTFLQWGKVYVLDSNQGAMVKRLFPCEDSEVVECRSDNPNYPPFRLPKSEIRSVSIVVGVIRFE